MLDKTVFLELIKSLVEKEDGNRTALARKLGVKRQDIERYLKGQIPSAEGLLSIANALNTTINWLLTGKEETVKEEPKKEKRDKYDEMIMEKLQNLKAKDDKLSMIKFLNEKIEERKVKDQIDKECQENQGNSGLPWRKTG